MAKGKGGPRPDVMDDPTAEEIVGIENVIDVGTVDQTIEALQDAVPEQGGYVCSGCKFSTPLLTEMEAHAAETGHGRAPVEEVQPELFSPPNAINREITIPLDEELLNQKKTRLASLYQSALDVKEEKKEADADFNARLKNIDEQMQEIARVLKKPFTYQMVRCEWKILEGENARGLFRIDTGEQIEKSPLTMEDKIAEEAKAAADNTPRLEVCKVCGEPATVQIDGDNQFCCDKHHLEGDVVRRLK